MHDFTPIPALVGGALIGLSASLLLLFHGRIAGISGIIGQMLRANVPDRAFRFAFLLGLLAAGLAARFLKPELLGAPVTGNMAVLAGAGLLVGYGTRLGGGCTSGHGVCGLSRLSLRSLVATLTFMATGFATTYVTLHVLGGAR